MGGTTQAVRAALRLVIVGGWTVKNAAEQCGVTTGSIYRHPEYREWLKQKGIIK